MKRRDEQGGAVSKLFWTVVVLAVLLVVVDRVGDFAAERVAADTLQSSQGLDQPPHVSIEGFPFLNQFATGRYERVRLSAGRVPVGSAPNSLTLSRVRLDFRTVTTSKSFDKFRARRARATATVSFAELSRRLGVKVRYGGGGRVRASKRFTVLGQTIEPTISVKPAVADGVLSFTGPRIRGLQDGPPEVSRALENLFAADLPMKNVPFDVTVQDFRVVNAGLELILTGKNVTYTRPS